MIIFFHCLYLFIFVKIFYRKISKISFSYSLFLSYRGIDRHEFTNLLLEYYPSLKMTMYGRKSCGPSVIAPLFLAHSAAVPDHSCLNCEGFARTKDPKDLYLMKNMVMHIVWPGGAFDTVALYSISMLLSSRDPH